MKDLKTVLLRANQRDDLKKDIDNYDKILVHAKDSDRGVLMAHRERAKKQLADQSPEPLTGTEKDKLAKLEKRLVSKITYNMPTDETMRKNPAGAVDWHQKWEKHNKAAIQLWKNIRIQLNPDSTDRDLANIERHRPSGQMNRMRTDAQIPGVMSYGNIDEEQWPFDAPENTALAQAQRHYSEENAETDVNSALDALDKAQEVHEPTGFGPSGKLTAEEYAALEDRLRKGREVLAQNRAAAKQVEEQLQAVPDVAEAV